jgi:hypothetical protein
MASTEWPFDQAPNVAATTSRYVTEEGRPILLVTHYEDDHSWGFQSGDPLSVEDGRVVGMGTILRHDPTLARIADLAPGWSAERQSVGGEWHRYQDQWEEHGE